MLMMACPLVPVHHQSLALTSIVFCPSSTPCTIQMGAAAPNMKQDMLNVGDSTQEEMQSLLNGLSCAERPEGGDHKVRRWSSAAQPPEQVSYNALFVRGQLSFLSSFFAFGALKAPQRVAGLQAEEQDGDWVLKWDPYFSLQCR